MLQTDLICSRFEVLTAVWLRIQVFWDVTLFHRVSGSWCLKVTPTIQTLGNVNAVTQHHIPEDSKLNFKTVYNDNLIISDCTYKVESCYSQVCNLIG